MFSHVVPVGFLREVPLLVLIRVSTLGVNVGVNGWVSLFVGPALGVPGFSPIVSWDWLQPPSWPSEDKQYRRWTDLFIQLCHSHVIACHQESAVCGSELVLCLMTMCLISCVLVCSSLAWLCGPFSLFLGNLTRKPRRSYRDTSPVWIRLQYRSHPCVIRSASCWLCLSSTLGAGRSNVFGN